MSRTPKPHAQPCSIAHAAALLADPWTVLMLRDAFRGVRRFDDFQALTGAAKTVTADRLKRLVAEGLMERTVYQSNPTRFEYKMTQKGRDVWPVLMTLWAWGDQYGGNRDAPPLIIRHKGCGQVSAPGLTCSVCGEALSPLNMRLDPGAAWLTPEGRKMYERWRAAVAR